jgi:hypothetical protein
MTRITKMHGKPLDAQLKQKFLAKLKATHGNVSKACQIIQISRNAAYEHKRTDADFSAAWDQVLESVYDEMEQELYNRSVKGWNEPVFYKGDIVGTIRKKSDRLLEFALKGNRAEKFRERLDINNHHSGSLDVNLQATIDSVYGSNPDNDPDNDSEPDVTTAEGVAGDSGDGTAGESE